MEVENDSSEWIDVSVDQDGGVKKKIIKAAPDDAKSPPDGYIVKVS
jgi:hypothetical protein